MRRRRDPRVWKTAIVLASILLVVLLIYQNRGVDSTMVPSSGSDRLDSIASNIVSGGPPKDGIPPIDRPHYVTAPDATFLQDNDIVFGVNYKGVVRAYPQKILVWHEIVNEEFSGEKGSVTYCPLTGSVIGFKGAFDGQNTDFGTSGKLVNSNLVMYDRAADSYIPQILGVAVSGPQKGTKLDEFPVVWTTWRRWKEVFPNTLVLSQNTGFVRAYGSDPYGSYERSGTYYQQGGPFFPVMVESDRFQPKEVMIGIEDETNALAIQKSTVRSKKLIQAKLGAEDIIVIYDERLDDALAYKTGGHTFTLQGGQIVDEAGSVWNIWGRSDKGELEFVNSFNVMWFAWYAFYPSTEVYEG